MSAFEKFMTLGDFVFDDVEDLATVGEAIQEHGIYKLDQSGIPKSYSVDSKETFEALYLLVFHSDDEFAPEEYRLGADEREGFASIGGDDYGWPESAIPNMELIKPKRQRKLLLRKKQLNKILGKMQEKGYACLPIKIYFNKKNIAKVLIGIGRGKKLYDKRDSIKKRDENRRKQRGEE